MIIKLTREPPSGDADKEVNCLWIPIGKITHFDKTYLFLENGVRYRILDSEYLHVLAAMKKFYRCPDVTDIKKEVP